MSSQLSKDLASLRIQREQPSRSRPWAKIVVSLAVIAASAAGYVYGRPALEARLFKPQVQSTEILSISPAQDSIDLTSTGYVVPQLVAKVGADVVGRIAKVHVREGESVAAGTVLFELERTQQQAVIASARAKVASAVARGRVARAAVAEARVPYERQKKLVAAGAAGSATAEDLATRLFSLEETARAAEAEAGAVQAEVRVLEVQLEHYVIKSPIDGVVQNKPAQVGEVVGPGIPLVELVNRESMLVETDVPEARMHLIREGQPCEILLDSAPRQRWRGAVVEVSPRINRSKATATVKVRFVDVPGRLSPEMAARVSFLTKELDKAEMAAPPRILVAKSAVVDHAGGKAVYTLTEGVVHLARVKLGEEDDDNVVLLDGPPAGARVVKDPPSDLRDGQPVKEGTE